MAKRLDWEKENQKTTLRRRIAQAKDGLEDLFDFPHDFDSGPSTSSADEKTGQAKQQLSQKLRLRKNAKDTARRRKIKELRQKLVTYQKRANNLKQELDMMIRTRRQAGDDLRHKLESRWNISQVRADGYRRSLVFVAGHGHSNLTKRYLNDAKHGDVNAQFILGNKYYNADGAPYDDVKAYAWLTLAAKQGHPRAGATRDLVAKALTLSALLEARNLSTRYMAEYANPSRR